VIANYPMVDVKIAAVDARTTKSIPTRWPSRSPGRRTPSGAAQAGPQLLEPMMEVEVTTRMILGDVMGDLNSRRDR